MPPIPPRRLNLGDGMILVAGLAGCFLLTRHYFDSHYPKFLLLMRNYQQWSATSGRFPLAWSIGEVAKVTCLWLAMFSPVLLLIRLRRPRPDWSLLLAQPGTTAVLVATVITAVSIITWAGVSAIEGHDPGLFFYKLAFARLLAHAGLIIAVVWACLFLTERWATERSAIDRCGRVLGLGWVAFFFALTLNDLHQNIMVAQLLNRDKDVVLGFRHEIEDYTPDLSFRDR